MFCLFHTIQFQISNSIQSENIEMKLSSTLEAQSLEYESFTLYSSMASIDVRLRIPAALS